MTFGNSGDYKKSDWYLALEKNHGKENQAKLHKACVAIFGLGGLGSNVALILARSGIGHLRLIDFDKVELSNLNRQQYKLSQVSIFKTEALKSNLYEINPDITIEIFSQKATEDNFLFLTGDASIVCEAFDKPMLKAALVNTILSKTNKFIVAASGLNGIGKAEDMKTRQVGKRLIVCGDSSYKDNNCDKGLFAARVILCASMQSLCIIRHILLNTL